MTRKWVYRDDDKDMKIITCNLPQKVLDYIHCLLKWGIVPSRSEYIRMAVQRQVEEDLKLQKYIEQVIETTNDTIRIPHYKSGKPIKILRRLE